MRTSRFVLVLGMAGLLFLAGCAETTSGGLLKSQVFSGDLMESKAADGRMKRLRVTDLDSWRLWHRNPTKGDGDNLIVKAEMTF